MNSGVNRLVEKLNTYADSDASFDVQHIINLATLDVICGWIKYNNISVSIKILVNCISETAMGVQVNALDNPESEMVQAFHEYVLVFEHLHIYIFLTV